MLLNHKKLLKYLVYLHFNLLSNLYLSIKKINSQSAKNYN